MQSLLQSGRSALITNPVNWHRRHCWAADRIRTCFTPCTAARSSQASPGGGLPAKRRLPRKPRSPTPLSDLTSGKDSGELPHPGNDFDQPVSLAALSRAHEELRATGQRKRPISQPVQRTSCPQQEPPPTGGSPRRSAQEGPPGQLNASPTPSTVDSRTPTPATALLATTAPTPAAAAPGNRGEERAAEGLGAGPGPRHPAVAFRTAAELRRMLQAAAAEAGPGPSSSGAVMAEQGGQAARIAAPAAGSSASPVAGGPGAAPPPRRFFAPPPAAARTSAAPGATVSSRGREVRAGNNSSSRSGSSSSNGHGAARMWAAGTTSLGALEGTESEEALGWDQAHVGIAAGGPMRVREAAAAATGSSAGGPGVHPAASPSAAAGLASGLEDDRDYQKAKQLALSLLERSPLPRAELSRRLLSRGHLRHHVEPLLAWLADSGVLNDRLYARMFATAKWNASLTAPAKIQKDLAAQGVSAEDVAAALVHVFGPSRKVRLTGARTTEELDVRAALLEGARRHADKGSGGTAGALASSGGAAGSSPGASRGSDRGGGGGSASGHASWVAEAKARAKERDSKRRRLAMWLQYRGHEMDVVLKVFELLKI